jgi:hypothetical protein
VNWPLNRAVAITTTIAAVGLGALMVFTRPITGDVGWFLYMAGLVVDGQRLYVDVLEVNPPLIVWLSIPVVLAERLSGMSHVLIFQLLVMTGALVSLAAAYRLARRVIAQQYADVFAAALAIGLFVLPASHWGQREHLFVLLATPYLVGVAACARDRSVHDDRDAEAAAIRSGASWKPVALGVAAGLGFALKPYFVPGLLAIGLWDYMRRRQVWRATTWAGLTILAYGLAVLVLTPEYLPQLRRLGEMYAAFFAAPRMAILLDPAMLIGIAALTLAAVGGEGRELRQVFGIATAFAMLAVLVQSKGFENHYVPVMAFSAALGTLVLIGLGSARQSARVAETVALLVLFGAAMLAARQQPAVAYRWSMIDEARSAIDGERAVVLTLGPGETWPVANYAGARWALATPSVWPIWTTESGVEFIADHLASALEQQPVVLVANPAWKDPVPVLSGRTVFADAWSEFVEVGRGLHYRVYRHASQVQAPRSHDRELAGPRNPPAAQAHPAR